ncbi:hypothetical protein Tco_0199318 [Tanacetum coccineum]
MSLTLAHVPNVLRESLPSGPDVYAVATSGVLGDGSRVHTHDHDGSEAPDESPDSILSSEPKPLEKHRPPPSPSILFRQAACDPSIDLSHGHSIYRADKSIIYPSISDDGSNGDGIGSGDECAGGAVHLARRSPAEGGDSEIGGDGDGVVMARSLSTSASGGRDMEV